MRYGLEARRSTEDEMTQKRERSVDFDVSPDVLLAILSSKEFLVAEQEADEGNESARCTVYTRSDTRVDYEIDITEFGRTMRGEIDRSKREKAKVAGSWDLERRQGRWTYTAITSSMANRIEVSGSTRLEASGKRARLHLAFVMSIKVPVIGPTIEKLVLKDVEKGEIRYDGLVRELIAKRI
jgi:hypothetical protein